MPYIANRWDMISSASGAGGAGVVILWAFLEVSQLDSDMST
jgi:hypothetical protein